MNGFICVVQQHHLDLVCSVFLAPQSQPQLELVTSESSGWTSSSEPHQINK